MTYGSRLVPTIRPAGRRRVRRRSIPRANLAPVDRSGTLSDRLAVPRVGMETRLALREALVATEAAAEQVRSLATLLSAVLAALSNLDLKADGTSAKIGASLPEIASLSPRERQVLALVAEGRSNKAIAEALFVSPNTVKTHVASLLTKLHAETRAHLAAIAAGGARSGPC